LLEEHERKVEPLRSALIEGEDSGPTPRHRRIPPHQAGGAGGMAGYVLSPRAIDEGRGTAAIDGDPESALNPHGT
jgi:hypothetical protein